MADLDAIEGRAPHDALTRTIASIGAPLWLDAGIASVDHALRALDCGVTRLIVGLETLPSFQVLESISKEAGHDRVAFSLDLRDGQPITTAHRSWRGNHQRDLWREPSTPAPTR